MARRSLTGVAAAATGAAMLLAASPVFAGTLHIPVDVPPAQLTLVKVAAEHDIDARIFWTNVNLWTVGVGVDRNVPTADKNALMPGMRADQAALQAIRQHVASDTTVAAVNADMAKVDQLRVFEFTLRRVGLVLWADDLSANAAHLVAMQRGYAAGIAAAKKAGKNVTAAQAADTDYVTQVNAASSAAKSVRASALGLSLAGYPANTRALNVDATALNGVDTKLAAAFHDATIIAQALPRH